MTPRDRMLAALKHKEPDRVPNGFEGFNREAFEIFRQRTGKTDFLEYFKADYRKPQPKGLKVLVRDTQTENPYRDPEKIYAKYHEKLPENARITEWGVGMVPGSNVAFDHIISPLKHVSSLKEIEGYPLADLEADYHWDGFEEDNNRLQQSGYATVGWMEKTIFEIAWAIRGFDEFMMDMLLNPSYAQCLCDRITELRCIQAKKFAEAGVDIIQLGDDVGMQDRMIMSVDTWQKWLKPGMKKIIDEIRSVNPEVIIFYHSDGAIEPVIPELIDIGIQVLNPIQPECMDPIKLKKEFGKELSFWGTIGTQTTMPFGTAKEVRETVKERIETLGQGGGLILAPTHTIEEDVPWKNLIAFFDALEEYGGY